MGKLIGVYHVRKNLTNLIRYILENEGLPKKVMLELPLNWREIKDTALLTDSYFFALARFLEHNGSEVIAGDIYNHYDKKLINKENNFILKGINSLKDVANILVLCLKDYSRYCYNNLNLIRRKQRNKGFLEIFDETGPDMTIVGDMHAKYLKSARPYLDYTLVRSNSFSEQLVYYTNFERLFNNSQKKKEKNI